MLTTLTAAKLREAADIKDRIAGLEKELIQTLTGRARNVTRRTTKRRCMSPEARAKIARAAKRRWRIAKSAGRRHL